MKEILTYSPPELHAALKKAWEESAAHRRENGVYPRMRLGLLLWRVKRERLYLLWGYRSLVQYMQTELGGLAIMTANFYTFATHRLWRFFGYSPDELEQFDKIENNRLRRCISLADTREDFERNLQAGPGIFRNNGSYQLFPGDRQQITWPRGKFAFNGQTFRLIDRILHHITQCLETEQFTKQRFHRGKLSPEQALTVLTLTYEVLLDHLPRDVKRLEAALRREFIRYDLPVEAANLSQMRWHRTRRQTKKGVALQEIAHAMTETSVFSD